MITTRHYRWSPGSEVSGTPPCVPRAELPDGPGGGFLLRAPWSQLGVLVARGVALEDDELGLQEVRQPLVDALAADAGLLEAAERDAEVGAERVVPDRAGAQLPGDRTG